MKKIPVVSDVVRIGNEQVEALAALPGSIVLLNRSLASFAQTVTRMDELVRRLDRLTEPLEGPLTALAPRLEALVPLLDEDLIGSLPGVLDSVQRNAVPALELIGQTQAQVASIASSVERLMTIMDDGFSRLQDLPGIALVSRLRGGGGGAKGATASAGAAATRAGKGASKASSRARSSKPTPSAASPNTPSDSPPSDSPPSDSPPSGNRLPPTPPGRSVPINPGITAEKGIRRTSKPEEHRSWGG